MPCRMITTNTTAITTIIITIMITAPAIIQIMGTTRGIAIDFEPGRPALPMTAAGW